MASNIPITPGSGASSVATEQIGNNQYQIIKLVGAETGSTSTLGITPDGSAKVSVIGIVQAFIAGGSIATSATANQSISGTVGASIIGTVPVTQSGAFVASVSGTVGASVIGHAPVVIVGGSILTSSTANQSVSGTVQVDVRGSVAVAIIAGSIAATFTPPANQSVSGTVGVTGSVAALQGTNPWTVVSSLAGGIFPVSGSVAAVITNTNVNVSGSVAAWITNSTNSSVITTFQNSSLVAVLSAPSIVGTYVEDAAHATGDRGLFVMQVRNDLMTSMTSANGDYAPLAGGPVGETIVANAPITKWVQGTADFRNGNAGASIIAIASGGTSVFTYITGVQVANMGSASVLVTLASGGSTLGYTIAPAGGGSNIIYRNALKTPGNFGFAASLSGIASVLVSAQGFTAGI
jgi:hypothetical protein